jgi:hypothetical protein
MTSAFPLLLSPFAKQGKNDYCDQIKSFIITIPFLLVFGCFFAT